MNAMVMSMEEAQSAAEVPSAALRRPGAPLKPASDSGTAAALSAALDALAHGAALIDHDGTLLHVNAAARTLLHAAHWTVVADRLRGRSDAERKAWDEGLNQACRSGVHKLVEIDVEGEALFAALVPLHARGAALVIALFGRHALCGALELQLFASRYGLSCSENQVLQKISAGLRPGQIAHRHGVAMSTVATQISSIRSKTGCASVQDLILKLARLPPLRPVVQGGLGI